MTKRYDWRKAQAKREAWIIFGISTAGALLCAGLVAYWLLIATAGG